MRVMAHTRMLLLVAALAAMGSFGVSCEPPVDDDVTCVVTGRVLLADGTPAAGYPVKLLRTELDTLEVDWVVGVLVNEDADAFQETTTDANGEFTFTFLGSEANSKNGWWAAYFVAYVTDKTVNDSPGMVATDSFTFSGKNPTKEIADMRFLTLDPADVTVDEDKGEFKVKWEATDLAPDNGKYIVHVLNSDWVEETHDLEMSLPLSALAPCSGLKPNGGECIPNKNDAVRVFAFADGLRYRSNWAIIPAENPRGMSYVPAVPDGGESYFSTCSGRALKPLIDGVFHTVSVLEWGDNLSADDLKCVVVDLGDTLFIEDLYIHGGNILNHQKSRVVVEATGKELPADADYWPLATFEGSDRRFWYLDARIEAPSEAVRYIRLRVESDENNALWAGLGEFSVYTKPLPTPTF